MSDTLQGIEIIILLLQFEWMLLQSNHATIHNVSCFNSAFDLDWRYAST